MIDQRNGKKRKAEGGTSESSSNEEELDGDVDSYRSMLMSSWEEDEDSQDHKSSRADTDLSQSSTSNKYSINSLFGDDNISRGPDMFDDVMSALDKSLRSNNDDILIIVSVFSKDEILALRRIIALFGDQKKIILFNCKLSDPVPREVITSEVVYSILPLVARESTSPQSFLGSNSPSNNSPPKVLVMRRFPNDWEIFVDWKNGGTFELAESGEFGRKGPSMDFIAGCVKRFLEFKIGNR